MNRRDDTISLGTLKRRLVPALKKIHARKAMVFGSFARGTQDMRSDLDMIVVMDTDKRFFRRYDDLDELYARLKGIAVDILVYTPDELERMSSRPFVRRALREGKLIYGS